MTSDRTPLRDLPWRTATSASSLIAWIPAAFLLAVFAFCALRMQVLALTSDEAYSYVLYLGQDFRRMFTEYNANLHFLHTLLTYASVKTFGLTEFGVRFPSLLMCALYLFATLRLSRLLFRSPWLSLLSSALLVVNPLILDHMVVARGYGMALALFALAMLYALIYVDADLGAAQHAGRPSTLVWIAALLGLCIGANLTFLFPAAALVATLALFVLSGATGAALVPLPDRIAIVTKHLLGPWLVLSALFWMIPFSRLQPNTFYFGVESLLDSLRTLMESSMGGGYMPNEWVIGFWGTVFTTCVISVAWSLFRRFRRMPHSPALELAGGTLLLTMAAVICAHLLFGVLYPFMRTGLFLLFLTPLWFLVLVSEFRERQTGPVSFRSWPGWAGIAVAAGFVLVLAPHIQYQRTIEWDFDANSRDIMRIIASREEAVPRQDHPIRISASTPMWVALQIYRDIQAEKHPAMKDVPIDTDRWSPDYDYYVYRNWKPDELQLATGLALEQIYIGPESRIALAIPTDKTRQIARELVAAEAPAQ